MEELPTHYNNHRKKYEERNKLSRKGWNDLLYSYEKDFDSLDTYHLNKVYSDKYNEYNKEEVVKDYPYWDTKENDEYYSLSKYQRLKLSIKNKVIYLFISD